MTKMNKSLRPAKGRVVLKTRTAKPAKKTVKIEQLNEAQIRDQLKDEVLDEADINNLKSLRKSDVEVIRTVTAKEAQINAHLQLLNLGVEDLEILRNIKSREDRVNSNYEHMLKDGDLMQLREVLYTYDQTVKKQEAELERMQKQIQGMEKVVKRVEGLTSSTVFPHGLQVENSSMKILDARGRPFLVANPETCTLEHNGVDLITTIEMLQQEVKLLREIKK